MPQTGITIGNTFGTQSGNVPASELDTNYSQLVTAYNTIAGQSNYFVDSGSAGSLVITVPSPLIVTYAPGLSLWVNLAATNTASGATINVNSLGLKTIVYPQPNNAPILPGQFQSGAMALLVYDGTYFEYMGDVFGNGTFTGTFTGTSGAAPTGTINWTISGYQACLEIPNGSSISGTSNANFFTMTGVPTYLQPTRSVAMAVPDGALIDNGQNVAAGNQTGAIASLNPGSSTLTFWKNSNANGWTTSGFKGLNLAFPNVILTYPLL
jgi:hypothetical protein